MISDGGLADTAQVAVAGQHLLRLTQESVQWVIAVAIG